MTPYRQLVGFALLVSGVFSANAAGSTFTESNERLTKAQAMLAQRCQAAGERINRIVDNVDGIFLLKIRPDAVNFGDQFALDDPYGHDLGGDAYIKSFLRGFFPKPSSPTPLTPPHLGYLHVEAIDPRDGQRYRYTGGMKEIEAITSPLVGGTGRKFKTTSFILDKVPAPGPPPRYGVTYDDISTREEREYWIAGSSLKVIDLQSNEVVAERVGYMMDPYQGSRAGGRSPWLLAASQSCPKFLGQHASSDQTGQTERFVEKALKPQLTQGK